MDDYKLRRSIFLVDSRNLGRIGILTSSHSKASILIIPIRGALLTKILTLLLKRK